MKNAKLSNKPSVYKNMKFLGLLSGRNLQPPKPESINNTEKKESTTISLQIPVAPPEIKKEESKEVKEDNDHIIDKKESADLDEKNQKKPKR